MRRILVFNDGLERGGTEVLLTNLLNHLVEDGHDVTLLLPQPSETNVMLPNIPSKVKVRYLYDNDTSLIKKKIGENLMIFFPRIFARWKKLNVSDYDVVVCFKECYYARIFSKMRVYKVLWIHNILYKRVYEIHSMRERLSVWLNKWQLKKVQKSYNKFSKILCVSDACKTKYLEVLYKGKEPKQDIRVLYNAIDLRRVVELSKAHIEPLPQGVVKFILLTRVSPEKRTDRLIDAAQRLQGEGYQFRIYILGDGVESAFSESVLSRPNLVQIVTFIDHVDNPFPYILQSNWSLCVSERESFSLALLESMALNTPVITTNCGGPADIVAGGKYGILTDNSAVGVYSAMKRVLDDPTLSVQYSSLLEEAVQRYDYQRWMMSVDEILELEN